MCLCALCNPYNSQDLARLLADIGYYTGGTAIITPLGSGEDYESVLVAGKHVFNVTLTPSARGPPDHRLNHMLQVHYYI